MTRLILVRHGQSEANLQNFSAGQTDIPLTELGRRQAQKAADYLVANWKIDRIYASDLSRAIHTAQPIADRLGLTIHTDRRLREIDTGDWAGLPSSVRDERYGELVRLSREDFSHMRYPNGESVTETYRRMVECITEIVEQNDGKSVMIASHGGALRAFTAYVLGFAEDEVGKSPSIGENASIQIYDWNDGIWQTVLPLTTEHLKDLALTTDELSKV